MAGEILRPDHAELLHEGLVERQDVPRRVHPDHLELGPHSLCIRVLAKRKPVVVTGVARRLATPGGRFAASTRCARRRSPRRHARRACPEVQRLLLALTNRSRRDRSIQTITSRPISYPVEG